MAVASLKQGAADFIEKPFNDNDLVDRVLEVLHQYAHLQEERERHLKWADKISSLSNREKQVLELALKGKLNKQIANDLDITMRTVEVHRARALEKPAQGIWWNWRVFSGMTTCYPLTAHNACPH
ncbi:response regulator transcription factor [Paenalcaligenes niemegkensis]|uniref:response regulator transcription factor n=1 Tax=Paenalcaligenes niemegkensis TaxID=2895469 RepID=UPI0027E2456D|nr:LuxR C-terminal-related transcriptional regulator [Paenalcaligenes niemegkensis]